ncbi:MAG: FAD-dependent oxidoreductase, partial [Alphaproteobacteria bacterium]|nr:FAD-dependent oxidoreductase [Alphaproteobacteria bacterium]
MSASEYDYDLFTIGIGSGGTRASRIAAGHGARVAAAEEYRVGGTCVIRGCVPKKMLVYGAHFAEDLEDALNFGWNIEGKSFDWVALRDHVQKDIDRLEGLYNETLENHGVEVFHERARITGDHEITLESGKVVTSRYILIATGARPHVPDCNGSEHIITSNEAFHLDEVPRRVLILGGGYIANEFAGIFNEFGAKVTLANRTDVILRSYDEALRDRLLQISLTKGIDFLFNTKFEYIRKREDGALDVKLTGHEERVYDVVMAATGRLANTEGLGLEDIGVELGERG